LSFEVRGPIGALALLATLGIAVSAQAQTRPTLEDVESRVEVLEGQVTTLETELDEVRESACIAADVYGDTYRPAHCDARCDCIAGSITEVAACRVETTGPSTVYSVDKTSAGYACVNLGFGPDDSCINTLVTCVDNNDCTAPYNRCYFGTCVIPSFNCVDIGDCPFLPPTVTPDFWTLSTTTGAVDWDVATCNRADPVDPATFTTNHKDAVECVAQVEAQLGSSCTPAP